MSRKKKKRQVQIRLSEHDVKINYLIQAYWQMMSKQKLLQGKKQTVSNIVLPNSDPWALYLSIVTAMY